MIERLIDASPSELLGQGPMDQVIAPKRVDSSDDEDEEATQTPPVL